MQLFLFLAHHPAIQTLYYNPDLYHCLVCFLGEGSPKSTIAVEREEITDGIKKNPTKQLMVIPKEDLAYCFEK